MNFSTIVTIDDLEYLFSFRKIETPGLLKFFVTVSSPFIQTLSFEMKREFGVWKILPPAPDWLIKIEPLVARILSEKIPYRKHN